MSQAWEKLCAAAGASPAVAVFLTSKERHMQEKLQFAHFAREVLKRRRGAPSSLVTVSGDDLDDALGNLAPPASAVQILVISPYAIDRGNLIAEAKRRWPLATAALNEKTIGGEAYVVVDLRPCPITDAGHVHTPVCMSLSRGYPGANATSASA